MNVCIYTVQGANINVLFSAIDLALLKLAISKQLIIVVMVEVLCIIMGWLLICRCNLVHVQFHVFGQH